MNSYLEEVFGLNGKCAIITGGAMGIGKGIAIAFAKAGAKVLIVDRVSEEEASETMNELKSYNQDCFYFRTDLSVISSLPEITDRAMKVMGDIDILVNNAGIYKYTAMTEMTEQMWDQVVQLNLKSAAFLCKEVANAMRKKGHGGRIINITSIDALKPTVLNLPHYDASKAGLRMLSRSLAKELAPYGILVNDIAPGGVNTPGVQKIAGDKPSAEQVAAAKKQTEMFLQMLPLRRMGEPADIGSVALFLAGKASSFMTGTTVIVDGGYLIM